ncbi:hypothetical protein [Thiocystis violascens]|uniref:Uncharacterized protein n=1 Tax=Thiocystis violascens (strain ATCC 17096 / DSM 198 / 6111) TaxID=765911 RepID=I3Y8X2_THIV6|nr:hypothetical protein [Thiocystis violascens]AFL73440.1 hypothetical protein Thivi_1434 [Thiocystis violascens DSM 198]
MSRTSPEAVFVLAQAAMERGDWETFFACLDRSDLKPLASMGIPVGEDPGGAYSNVCLEHGVPVEALQRVRACAEAIQDSAQRMMSESVGAVSGAAPPEDLLQQSLRHRDLVKALDRAIAACLGFVTDLAAFTAKAERLKRATMGGGSVSSSLFVGESLVDVRVEGKKATGIRRMQNGWSEPIAFVQRRDQWSIKFLPKRR